MVDGPPDRVLTLPNALSTLRLLGVPLFLWLVLDHHDGWALILLIVSGISDYADGKLARALGQTSRLGALLDPAADRLYIVATLIGLTARSIVPWQLTAILVARDVVLLGVLLALRRRAMAPLPVHFLGKAATFNLLYAFPFLLLGDGSGFVAAAADAIGWSFAVWGTVLYCWAAGLYVVHYRLVTAHPRVAHTGGETTR